MTVRHMPDGKKLSNLNAAFGAGRRWVTHGYHES